MSIYRLTGNNGTVVRVNGALRGPAGPPGPQGIDGNEGPTGPPNVLSIGSVIRGDDADATITGTSPSQVLNLVLPKGDTGSSGANGSDGEDGDNGREVELQANATHIQWRYVGDSSWSDLLPLSSITGANGADGSDGAPGAPGSDGQAATITIDSTTTGNPGTNANVSNVGTSNAAVLKFTIPRGEDGSNGSNGTDGQTVLSGSGAPDSGSGQDGDFYIDTANWNIYGPKASGSWGVPTSLVGPAGSGSGDMLAATYDPNNRNSDAFSMDNMVESATKKVMTDSERTKLSGVATSATANDTDANLKNRANHTGTQTASTISDFDAEVSNNTDVSSNTTARHTHSNKSVLDATTASFTSGEKTKLSGIETDADVTDSTNVQAALPTGTNGQVLKHNGTNWQPGTDNNTTYTELTEAEINAGTASTARAISGRRAQNIVDKARAGLATSSDLSSHTGNTSNPHSVTKSQIGLGSVSNDLQLKASDLDTDVALAANSDTRVPSQKAVKAYADSINRDVYRARPILDFSMINGSDRYWVQGAAANKETGEIYISGNYGVLAGTILRIERRNLSDGSLIDFRTVTQATSSYSEGLPYFYNGSDDLCFLVRLQNEESYAIYNYTQNTVGSNISIKGKVKSDVDGDFLLTTDYLGNTGSKFYLYDWDSVKAGTPTLLRTIYTQFPGQTPAKTQGVMLRDGEIWLIMGGRNDGGEPITLAKYGLDGKMAGLFSFDRTEMAQRVKAINSSYVNMADYLLESEGACKFGDRFLTINTIEDTAQSATATRCVVFEHMVPEVEPIPHDYSITAGYTGEWLSWTPTLTGWSSAPTNSMYRYRREYNRVQIRVRQQSAGTSNSGDTFISLPVLQKEETSPLYGWHGTLFADDTSSPSGLKAQPGVAIVNARPNQSPYIETYKDWKLTEFAASGNKRIPYLEIEYETE